MIFMMAARVDGIVSGVVYVDGGRQFFIYGCPSVAAALKKCWQWTVNHFGDFPVQGHA